MGCNPSRFVIGSEATEASTAGFDEDDANREDDHESGVEHVRMVACSITLISESE